jgi:hypothetical protein
LELMLAMPIFARIEVKAANTADKSAKRIHMLRVIPAAPAVVNRPALVDPRGSRYSKPWFG